MRIASPVPGGLLRSSIFALAAMSTTTVERPRAAGPGSGLGGNWMVIVLNDDHNTFDHVAQTLARVIPGVSLENGFAIADRIHSSRQGRGLDRPPGARRALLGAATGRGADDGAAGAALGPYRRVVIGGEQIAAGAAVEEVLLGAAD